VQTPQASGTLTVTLVTLSTSTFSTASLFLLNSSLSKCNAKEGRSGGVSMAAALVHWSIARLMIGIYLVDDDMMMSMVLEKPGPCVIDQPGIDPPYELSIRMRPGQSMHTAMRCHGWTKNKKKEGTHLSLASSVSVWRSRSAVCEPLLPYFCGRGRGKRIQK
jgi:hypothetical protein